MFGKMCEFWMHPDYDHLLFINFLESRILSTNQHVLQNFEGHYH